MEAQKGLGFKELAAIILVTAIWGFNFVVIAAGLDGVPPLLLVALRFALAAVPAVFLVQRPATSIGLIAAYGLALGVGEFAFLFIAIKLGAGAGLSSVVLQVQAPFTALLAVLFLRERLKWYNLVGMAVAFGGMALIGLSRVDGQAGAHAMSLLPFLLLMLAALGWAGANIIARKAGPVNALGLMVWSSLFSPLPLLGLSLLFEGPSAIAGALQSITWLSVGAIAFLAFISTLVGYGIWNKLIARRGASTIAPFSLLVPFFGLSSAALFRGERFSALQLLAAGLILAGLCIHTFGGRWRNQ